MMAAPGAGPAQQTYVATHSTTATVFDQGIARSVQQASDFLNSEAQPDHVRSLGAALHNIHEAAIELRDGRKPTGVAALSLAHINLTEYRRESPATPELSRPRGEIDHLDLATRLESGLRELRLGTNPDKIAFWFGYASSLVNDFQSRGY
jgi:hypothetical protein